MKIEVDPSFKKSGTSARARRKSRRIRRLIAAGGATLTLGVVVVIGVLWWVNRPPGPVAPDLAGSTELASDTGDVGGDFAMVQTEGSDTAGVEAAAAVFIDLPRDPMILHFSQSDTGKRDDMAGPDDLDPERVGPPAAGRLSLIRDELLQAERRLVTTIPSTREDFAFFQAQRSKGIAELTSDKNAVAEAVEAAEVADLTEDEARGTVVTVDAGDGSWGTVIDTGSGTAQDAGEDISYVETRIENTTSVAFTLHQAQRYSLYRDIIVVLSTERTLEDILSTNGFGEVDAAAILRAVRRDMGEIGTLPITSIVAMRVQDRPEGGQELLQISIYDETGYRGSLARTGAGRYTQGADPWYDDDLVAHAGQLRAQIVSAPQDVRLLDALYSAAIRNGLSTTVVGEMIVVMSQLYDLDRYAAEGDTVTILHANTPGPKAAGVGEVLYVAIKGPSGDMRCYVAQASADDGFSCYGAGGRSAGGGHSGGLGGGLIVPVEGTRTSGFGPRMHPILHKLVSHDGVDWAAPTGTPVHAAGPGRISRANRSDSYGNIIYIDHPGGAQTRYAHLDRFADGIRSGMEVQAGDLIGYVGTTGRSTGPHLHFEVRMNGTPVDPLVFSGGAGTPSPGSGGSDDQAVEILVNQIIKVESGGRADAKNTRSSATGLGQFINSTWLRMMRTYRPDLVASMSEAELLALRTNPELSREMVRNLARENEAFLRSRGHQITAGRLYLAHFLGPQGADIALRADPDASVLVVMGQGVVSANPFLDGWTIGQLWAWSDKKMTGRHGGGSSAPPPPVVTAELRAYMKEIDEILAEAG